MSRDIAGYQKAYLGDYGFEATLVDYRQRLLLERLHKHAPAIVVEIGCGPDLLYGRYLEQAEPLRCWLAVEPAPDWAAQARSSGLPGLSVVGGFLEESVDAIRDALPAAPDLVICSGVLQEVPSASALLCGIRRLMTPESLLHVNVANARSLHRRLAVAMGLIPTLDTMSDRNIQLQQHRVYDVNSLDADLARAGFRVLERGGGLLKPFTHAQMERVAPLLGTAVMDGLYALGTQQPDWACEIFAEAKLA